jgi:hypothetical protein
MARGRRHTPEQIASILRQVELDVANGKAVPLACIDAGIAEYTFYRWRGEREGLGINNIKRIQELERENMKLKRLIVLQRLNISH